MANKSLVRNLLGGATLSLIASGCIDNAKQIGEINDATGGTNSVGGSGNTGGATMLATATVGSRPTSGSVSAIAVGTASYSCALVNGSAYCWGDNTSGELGNGAIGDLNHGNIISSLVPVQVQGLTTGVTAIAAGGAHTCAVVSGKAFCWGDNPFGQLGNGSYINSPVPVPVQGLSSGVTAIAAGAHFSCALVNGSAYCWGGNGSGMLGNNSTADRSPVPVPVQGLSSGVTAIAAGATNGCALVNGSAYCWGFNSSGELGNNSAVESLVPVQVQGLSSGVTAIAASYRHICGLVNGSVYCWGFNGQGQLGIGKDATAGEYLFRVPVQVQGLPSGVTALAGGYFNDCALANGNAYCWGDNFFGALGNGTTASSLIPVQVQGLTTGVTAIAPEADHTCALVDGSVYCWGDNTSGELGNNSTTSSLVPVQVLLP